MVTQAVVIHHRHIKMLNRQIDRKTKQKLNVNVMEWTNTHTRTHKMNFSFLFES